ILCGKRLNEFAANWRLFVSERHRHEIRVLQKGRVILIFQQLRVRQIFDTHPVERTQYRIHLRNLQHLLSISQEAYAEHSGGAAAGKLAGVGAETGYLDRTSTRLNS